MIATTKKAVRRRPEHKEPMVADFVWFMCAISAFIVIVFWLLVGPGRRGDEGMLCMLVVGLLAVPTGLATLARPSLLWNTLLYPGLFLAGYVATWAHVASMYDYSFWKLQPLATGLWWTARGMAMVLAANVLSMGLRWLFRKLQRV